ncbi:hypothetical protein JOE11_002580 [Robbsia andropogonis]
MRQNSVCARRTGAGRLVPVPAPFAFGGNPATRQTVLGGSPTDRDVVAS